MKKILWLCLLMLGMVACAPTGAPNIKADMSDFLAQKGLSNVDLKCSMLGNGVTPGPDGMCLLPLTDGDVNALVSNLGLQPKTDTNISWSPSGPDCWTRLDFHDQSLAKWYVSPPDDTNLQMSNGGRFVYFRLFYLEDKSAACISISYSS